MNCTRFRAFLGAFADGELDVEHNVEALEHLNMCPRCARSVAEVQELKSKVKQTWPVGPAPARLRRRIKRQLAVAAVDVEEHDDVALPIAIDDNPVAKAVAIPAERRYRILVPLGIAAGVLFAIGGWQLTRQDTLSPGTKTVVAHAVSDVREQHLRCVANWGFDHHDESLGRDHRTVARRLGDRLNMPVLVPDLTEHGFEFIGADKCGIRGRVGGHALYHAPKDGMMLSLFTVRRIREFDAFSGRQFGGRSFFTATEESARVVAWHDDEYSFVVCACGEMGEDLLLSLAADVRRADRPLFKPADTWLAQATGR